MKNCKATASIIRCGGSLCWLDLNLGFADRFANLKKSGNKDLGIESAIGSLP
jgi:hypothetical protein